jgi:O-antigen/teichoic acid export membrane protein
MQLQYEYFRSCRLMASLIVPLGIVGWFFAPCIFQIWLGREDSVVTNVFRWLLLGIACSGLMWLPAALQQAHRWTSLHVAMIAGALIVGCPLMIWTIKVYGTAGATAVWVLHGISDITLGLWLMHRRLLKGKLALWYKSVLLPPILLSIPWVACLQWIMPQDLNGWTKASWVAMTSLILLGAVLVFNRGRDFNKWQA